MRILFLLVFAATSFAQAQPKDPIRLGATIPLTGDFATYGTLIKNGIELGIDELKSEGINATVTYEDVPYPGPRAVSAINKLVSTDKIQGLAGNFLNPAIPAMAPVLMRNKVLSFHTAIADDLILDAGDYIVSTNAKIKDEATELANYAFNKMGARTACVLFITTTFGENYATHFVRRFEELGGTILFKDTTAIGDTNLKPVLTKVKSFKPDVFFAAYFGTNMGVVLKQARSVAVSTPILGVYETEDTSVLEVAGSAAEGVRFFVPEAVSAYPERKQFEENYEKRFGKEPLILAKNAYDATKILGRALSQCRGDSKCAMEKVYQIKNYPGASGRITIDRDGGAQKTFVLKQIKNGKFERAF